ncbi:hypothetical protein ACHAP8_010980 [Fusarium lateritium]
MQLNKFHVYLSLLLPACQGTSQGHQRPDFDLGAFRKPSSEFRPPFRYWLPDSSIDSKIVASDIKSAAALGAGGVELVGFYEYGGELGVMPKGANWSTYGFGTPAYRDILKDALEAHSEAGILMDFIIGPNQGQGVPANSEDKGLQWDLVPYTAEVPLNNSFAGTVPGWSTGKLISLVTALVWSNRTVNTTTQGLAGMENITHQEYILRHDTLEQRLDDVDPGTGRLQLSLPAIDNGTHYRMFAFYEKLSGYRSLHFNSNVTKSIFDNGSYAVDHFDARGAQLVAQFWEDNMLTDEISALISKVGRYAWEDSLELPSNITWSTTLSDRFQNLHGYRLETFLPLIAYAQNNLAVQSSEPGSFKCLFDSEDEGVGYINDYRAALVDGYQEYLDTLRNWANNVLKIQLSVQPAYGMPMDMLATVPFVDAPECESLSFIDSIDAYRQMAGPAQLTSKNVISNEMGAIRGKAYQLHVPDLLFSINRALAGGVNRFVIHGQGYTGSYYQTTWPGYTPFRYLFSDPWSPQLPIWNNGMEELLVYISRMQYTQQQGVPKVDVAIYNKQSATSFEEVYQAKDLLEQGWSYNYLSPDNLQIRSATVKNRLLTQNGPAWKAFVVEAHQNLTHRAIKKLQSFANAGLPILISGGVPGQYPEGKPVDSPIFQAAISRLLGSKNVYEVKTGQVASKLSSLGIKPNVRSSTNGTWYTTWREASNASYVMVYSDLLSTMGNIIVQHTGKPYRLDPWTGNISSVLVYEQSNNSTTIPLTLDGNQTVVLMFNYTRHSAKLGRSNSVHLTQVPRNVLGVRDVKDVIHLSVAHSNHTQVVLSNGTRVSINASDVHPSFELKNWNLTVEHWEAPDNLTASLRTVKYNTTHYLSKLSSWKDIPSLTNTSGIGFYSTKFDWKDDGFGAGLSLPRVIDSVSVKVNGHDVGPLDMTNPYIDISSYLRGGTNELRITTPTTMWNYIRTILDELITSGSLPLPITLQQYTGIPIAGATDGGLLGPIRVVPIKHVPL